MYRKDISKFHGGDRSQFFARFARSRLLVKGIFSRRRLLPRLALGWAKGKTIGFLRRPYPCGHVDMIPRYEGPCAWMLQPPPSPRATSETRNCRKYRKPCRDEANPLTLLLRSNKFIVEQHNQGPRSGPFIYFFSLIPTFGFSARFANL